MMDFETLLRRHQALLAENKALKEENLSLKIQLGLADPVESQCPPESIQQKLSPTDSSLLLDTKSKEKIRLFMSLFKGREDVYARRWESK